MEYKKQPLPQPIDYQSQSPQSSQKISPANNAIISQPENYTKNNNIPDIATTLQSKEEITQKTTQQQQQLPTKTPEQPHITSENPSGKDLQQIIENLNKAA